MPVPNHKKEIDDHLFQILDQTYGRQAVGPDQNKYSVVRHYRPLTQTNIQDLVKSRVNASRGTYIITRVSRQANSKQMMKQKYEVDYRLSIFMGTSGIRESQSIDEDQILYEMDRDLMAVLIESPIELTGNPVIGIQVADDSQVFTEDEYLFQSLIITIKASLKNVPS